MTKVSSEYGFPIFISSTDYNLIDLRAELARYLLELGYRPILSSFDGFHDNSPEFEPWESCLQVLQSAYVMVLVIDGKYGECFEWKNFASIIGDRRVSPTHAEYLFAHKTKMRMLVFVRREILTHYQSFKTAMKTANGDREKAKENLAKTLPRFIAFEALEFVEEIKTNPPIPWIKPFDSVTDIKGEIQKKMLNELAELFLFKNRHLEAVVKAFAAALDDLPKEKRTEILEKIGATKELVTKVEAMTGIIFDLKREKENLTAELKEKSEKLEGTKDQREENEGLKKKITELTRELKSIDTKINDHELTNADYILSGTSSLLGNPNAHGTIFSSIYGGPQFPFTPLAPGDNVSPISNIFITPKCQKCGSHSSLSSGSFISLTTCPTCKRSLCRDCFNGPFTYVNTNTECVECTGKRPSIFATPNHKI